MIASKAPGSSVEIEVLRNGKKQNFIVTLGVRPSALVRGGVNPNVPNTAPAVEFKNTLFSAPTPQDLQRNGAKEGVVVQAVQGGALSFILSPGDIVAAVNNYPTPNIETFKEVTSNLENAQSLAFAIYKNGFLVYRSVSF